MKTLIAAVAFAMALAAPAFAQSVHAWGWKGALAAPASAKSAYAAASFNGRCGRSFAPGRKFIGRRSHGGGGDNQPRGQHLHCFVRPTERSRRGLCPKP